MEKTKKHIVIVLIIILVIAILSIGAFVVITNKKKKQEEEYNNLMISIITDMYLSEYIANYHSNYISSIWYNAIFKKKDSYTNNYAYPVDKYGYGVRSWVDFSTAINNYISTNTRSIKELKEKKEEIGNDLKTLQSLPNESNKEELELLLSMYGNYTSLVSLVCSPTGTYKDYVEKCNKYSEDFTSEYNKLLILVPDADIFSQNVTANVD